jgi:methyl-accepting chemotaxis protein
MIKMFSKQASELKHKMSAIDRVQAVIEFELSGTILNANENFLATVGYTLPEIVGKHHSIFLESGYKDSEEYKQLWDNLRAGKFQAGQFKRVGKAGNEIWIQASYDPILDKNGKPYKVVKLASNITDSKIEANEKDSMIKAIGRSQAVIEFTLDGIILNANINFLNTLGYSLNEIKGKHHSLFVESSYKSSSEYSQFWDLLKKGEFQSGQFKRVSKSGDEIWIQASYNPILDASGRPYKVVKFATDVTDQVKLLSNLRVVIDNNFSEIDQAVNRSQLEASSAIDIVQSTGSNVQMMAAAAEELATSVAEISESMAKSQEASDSVFSQVNSAGEFTKRLLDAASSMGGIVGLISNIAGQINLLALNATIESARAGEAGRGFAVVAQEVKNLATQAAKATEQISTEINGVQSISSDVVNSLESIKNSVEIVRNNVVATASAVEEQSAVTKDMSENMQNAERAVAAMVDNMSSINSSVTQVSSAVSVAREATKVLVR